MSAIRFVRRRFLPTVIAASMALGASVPALAADDAAARKRPARAERAAIAVVPETAASGTVLAEAESAVPVAQVVFQVLLAEIALRRGEAQIASDAYANLAFKTGDPKLFERTVEVAGFARRLDLALVAARRWVEAEPDSRQAQLVLASVMIMSNQMEALPPLLIRMLEADKGAVPENLLGLNRMLARNPDRVASFGVIEKVARQFVGVAEAHYAMAVAAAGAGQLDRARIEARRALELRGDWEVAATLYSQLQARLSPDEAISTLQSFVDKHPAARDARIQLARLMVSVKRFTDARQQFEAVLAISPENPDAVFSLGVLAVQQNDLAEAEKQFKRFLLVPGVDKNYAYYFLGQIAEERGQADDALGFYTLMTGGEHYLQSRVRSSRLLAEKGRLDEARRQLRPTAVTSAEDRVQLAIAEAGVLRDARQIQTAFDLLEALLAKQPDQPDLLYESSLLAEKLGHLGVMEKRLRRLIELRPDSAQAYNALGYAFADRNQRLAEARVLIEKALSLAPDDFFILDSMGWVLFRQGDLPAALRYLERAYQQRNDPEIAAHIGEVLWVMGREAEARAMWLDAQKKSPDNETLAETVRKFLR